ncbi:MAG: hypothetical protein ASARMPREDX12_002333 [Alectoria sarmentosa]|nr:MAG: hypothetical protein ASARMPRED_007257 [Alectoria sarmentosa]CAD6586321.1 MAG: hypothetical protein ASARMPREDX12_002333 [Alectoria sarmentosa]
MQWGHDADAKLFMHVLKIHNVKLDFPALAMAMGNDVTPKAITHRIAKLRSMAQDASSPAAGASAGLSLPQPNKRTAPAKQAPRAPGSPSPAGKKGTATATAANKTPVGGTKRTATGAVKNGKGKVSGGSPLQNVIAAYNGNGDEDNEDEDEDEDEVVVVETPSKKVKTAKADMAAGSAGQKDESAEGGDGEGGVEYA